MSESNVNQSNVEGAAKKYDYFRVVNHLLNEEGAWPLSGPAWSTYMYLALRRNSDTGECFPSHQRISQDTGYSRSTISRALIDLEYAGYIEILTFKRRDVNANNWYIIKWDTDEEARADIIRLATSRGLELCYRENVVPDYRAKELAASAESKNRRSKKAEKEPASATTQDASPQYLPSTILTDDTTNNKTKLLEAFNAEWEAAKDYVADSNLVFWDSCGKIVRKWITENRGVTISGYHYDQEVVKSKISKLTQDHIAWIVGTYSMRSQTAEYRKLTNPESYMGKLIWEADIQAGLNLQTRINEV